MTTRLVSKRLQPTGLFRNIYKVDCNTVLTRRPVVRFAARVIFSCPEKCHIFQSLRSARYRALRAKPETPPSGRVFRLSRLRRSSGALSARPRVSTVCQRACSGCADARPACRASGAPVARSARTPRRQRHRAACSACADARSACRASGAPVARSARTILHHAESRA